MKYLLKHFLFGLFCIGCQFTAFAIKNIDSLIHITKGDFSNIDKVEAHYSLAILYGRKQNDKSLWHVYEAQTLAKEINYAVGIGKTNFLIVELFEESLNIDSVV
jgi:hypothetical protein